MMCLFENYSILDQNPSHSLSGDRGDGDEIQWPALDHLKPGNLKKTVSSMMLEWEKSLTPPPEDMESRDLLTGSPRVNGSGNGNGNMNRERVLRERKRENGVWGVGVQNPNV